MELGRGSFAEMEWPFIYRIFTFLLYLLFYYIYSISIYSIPGQNKISIFFLFYAP